MDEAKIITIREIEYENTKKFILKKHYSQRMPNIKYSFGLFIDNVLEGICTVGKPASPFLCSEICGKENSLKVWELNRLVVNDGLPKNSLSRFVGGVLKKLKFDDLILVSFADEGAGHCGYIYQATNWIYTGKTKERTDKYMPNNKHPRHYSAKYNYLRKFRTSKFRYVYFTGKSKKIFLKKLKYPPKKYPKQNNTNYVLGERIKTKIINKKTGEVFFE